MNHSFADFERRVFYVSKNFGKRDTAARVRSMHRLVKNAAECDELSPGERATIVAMIVQHWPEGDVGPKLNELVAQCTNLRAAHKRWQSLRDEAARSLAEPAPTPSLPGLPGDAPAAPAAPAAPTPPYNFSADRAPSARRGTNYSIYLRNDVHAWLISQCPADQRGKAELVRAINELYRRGTSAAQVCPDNPAETQAFQANNRAIETAIALLVEAGTTLSELSAGSYSNTVLDKPASGVIRQPLPDELRGAAYMLQEMLPDEEMQEGQIPTREEFGLPPLPSDNRREAPTQALFDPLND